MLTLSRRSGESIQITINENVDPDMTIGELFAAGPLVLQVSEIRSGLVRLSFDAPLELRIMRNELTISPDTKKR